MAVEFAFIAPVLLLMMFGVIEFGLTLNDYQSIRQGAREGARDAVVGDYRTPQTSCGLNGAAATGSGTNLVNARTIICRTKQRAGLGNTVRVKLKYTADPTGFDSEKVKICVTRKAQSASGLLGSALNKVNLETQIEMRAEKDLLLTSTQETDPSNKNWSWCV